jgi:hypothetical protein
MSLSFCDIVAKMAGLKKMDSSECQFLKVQITMKDATACYRDV